MNKAFVREPEDTGEAWCPRCQSLGSPVGPAALDAHVRGEARGRLTGAVWYCGYAGCEVAYFTALEAVVTTAELQGPVYPKDPGAPLCACFGFTLDDIEADVLEGQPRRIRALAERARSGEAQCETLAADGRSCLREVQRLYRKLSEGAGG